MIQLLQPHSHFYLVASNVTFLLDGNTAADKATSGAWRDGAEGRHLLKDLPATRIYTGNRTLLELSLRWEAVVPVLETRDADDGLQSRYLEFIQHSALTSLSTTTTISLSHGDSSTTTARLPKFQWMYWCSRRRLEWHVDVIAPSNRTRTTDSSPGRIDDDTNNNGLLLPIQHSKLCITPGITVGFAVGVSARAVPVVARDKLYKTIQQQGACHHSTAMNATTTLHHSTLDCLHWV